MKQFLKFFLLSLTIIALLGGLGLGVLANFHANELHYSRNLPHAEDREPLMVVLADHIDVWESSLILQKQTQSMDPQELVVKGGELSKSPNFYSFKVDDRQYIFDSNAKLRELYTVNIQENRLERQKLTSRDQQEMVNQFWQVFGPLVKDLDQKPDINLQLLYTIINYWRFR
ncbi:hypothetical protein [Vaginisenegalia massiliensis]|uniref:hypothetical protein n=1 Tax=Vaginisenegalia massiliensis TaxID=2058294 RepID=UPI000F53CA94|nr:hypothetical protein [Vaginisenegalia massiliensis]